jgi:nucleotide-binding universal stress UspA family protein
MSSQTNDRGPSIQRLLFVADATVADVRELPPQVRAVLDTAQEVYVVTPSLPGRMAWLADEVDRFRHVADERLDTVLGHMRSIGVAASGDALHGSGRTPAAVLRRIDGRQIRDPAHGEIVCRQAIVATVWQPTRALGSFAWSGTTAGMVDFVELDRATAEDAGRVADAGAAVARSAGLSAETVVIEAAGTVWQAIVEFADHHDAAAIVMGPRWSARNAARKRLRRRRGPCQPADARHPRPA